MSTLIIITTILTILFLAFVILKKIEDIKELRKLYWYLFGAFFTLVVVLCYYVSRPSAMDVYQGKTELEYTIRGNEVVDSVVVYKAMED